ncbi:hypothetical protein CTA2_2744 [Colletotrichum tanaceti]|uniref:Protein kinase domain-containing protein n=1 Tax=Colletotrichum tanaceti TaxID=1306861 RepID=A0A4U6XA68_9PEZI|nr:hypothetical protein CTA2_2744 [Colletotrichum tanaceti]TKW51902.1 hypothetical protein CTA1_2932 [Colletotrichum tanaceti]
MSCYEDCKPPSREERREQEARLRYLEQEIRRYDPGETLTLYPRDPGPPHGLPEYKKPPEHDLKDGWIPYFDPTKEIAPQERAQVEVLEIITGGIDLGAQLLLCKVLKAPVSMPTETPTNYMSFSAGMKLVLKVFDPIFFPEAEGWEWCRRGLSKNVEVDGHLSREANAYQYLFAKKITGHPHIVPQFHGSWAVKFDVGGSAKKQWRCAGAVLIEYIEGVSFESLCDRDEKTEYMIPETTSLRPPGSADASWTFNEPPNRLKVFKTLLHNCVSFLHTGSDHRTFLPRDVFLTLGNNGVDLDEPRVVILDYSYCIVWSHTIESKVGMASEVDPCLPEVPSKLLLNVAPMERMRRPPHPADVFDTGNLAIFAGWFPSDWMQKPHLLHEWLKSEFGEVVEGEYSTLDELEKIMEHAIAEAKRLYSLEKPPHADDITTAADKLNNPDMSGS